MCFRQICCSVIALAIVTYLYPTRFSFKAVNVVFTSFHACMLLVYTLKIMNRDISIGWNSIWGPPENALRIPDDASTCILKAFPNSFLRQLAWNWNYFHWEKYFLPSAPFIYLHAQPPNASPIVLKLEIFFTIFSTPQSIKHSTGQCKKWVCLPHNVRSTKWKFIRSGDAWFSYIACEHIYIINFLFYEFIGTHSQSIRL